MNLERLPAEAIHIANSDGGRDLQAAESEWAVKHGDWARAGARARLAAASRRYQRRQAITNETYYGSSGHVEEVISCASVSDAVVTRNHYGSLVLNATRTLFIDVDIAPPNWLSRLLHTSGGPYQEPWQSTLDDLRTVLADECEEGFRIYRTAAGFRILATRHQFQPSSPRSQMLMNDVGADRAFMRLCRIQRSFRARLTPKPWRCGSTRLPSPYPRESAESQVRFDQWLSQYEWACRDRATCRYLGSVGPEEIHERVAPVVEFHDRTTKAFEALELA